MEILLYAKAPRADIYSQFVSALRTTAGASRADRVGRDPWVPPRSTHCSRRGTRAPPYRVRGRMGRTGSSAPTRFVRDVGDAVPYAPCHCEPVRRLARQSVSPQRKGRIPTPVTRSLARNDSAAALIGRRGRRPLQNRNGGAAKRADRCPPFTFLLYMTALSATMRCKNTAPACLAPHGHR